VAGEEFPTVVTEDSDAVEDLEEVLLGTVPRPDRAELKALWDREIVEVMREADITVVAAEALGPRVEDETAIFTVSAAELVFVMTFWEPHITGEAAVGLLDIPIGVVTEDPEAAVRVPPEGMPWVGMG
jgi:hypothetical protein